MSYDSSHRRWPPRQERSPNATPKEPWRAYRDDDTRQADGQESADVQGSYWATAGVGYRNQAGYQDVSGGSAVDRGYQQAGAPDPFADYPGGSYGGATDDYAGHDDRWGGSSYNDPWNEGYGRTGNGGGAGVGYGDDGDAFDGASAGGHGGTATGYMDAQDGYGDARDGYGDARDGYLDTAGGFGPGANGYGGTLDEYAGVASGYASAPDRYPQAPDDFAGIAYGYDGIPDDFADAAGNAGWDDYREPALSDPVLTAPDAGIRPDSWRAVQERRREARRRGLMVGAVTGFLAAAVAIGVSTLAAAFVGRQAAPVIVVGDAFTGRSPSALKNLAAEHFGMNGPTMLHLGLYVAMALVAMAIGLLARHAAVLGVAGVAALSLVSAFIIVTRPESRVTDVVPSVLGGLAGVAALLWLVHASAPVAPVRNTRGGDRRRAR